MSSPIIATALGDGHTRLVHGPTGAAIATDTSPEFGGGGRTFSATDLVAAALASCIASTVEPLATRHGVPPGSVAVEVAKEVATEPKRIVALPVTIRVSGPGDRRLAVALERAGHTCVVDRSLHPDVARPIGVVFDG